MKYCLLLLLIIVVGSIKAQHKGASMGSVKGRLNVRNGEQPVADATVALLHASDSSVAKSTFASKEGLFILDKLQEGTYRLYITHIGYRPVWRELEVNRKDTLIDLGLISMEVASIILNTVEIASERPAMVVKKDTIEFNVSTFGVSGDAVVEELLKKLPGIQIERDGTVKVNGEIVKKLLVDGKLFFADDPRIATRNLTVDMIDKIQFIDRKSEWSRFTSVNDSQFEKTVNITIKKDMKDGYFGRLGAALGSQSHFAVNGSVYKFNDDQQFSIWGNGNDVSGYQDAGVQSKMSIGGSSNVNNWTGGATYNKDFGDKLKVGANYSINDNYTDDIRKSERQNILPDTTWYYNQSTRSFNSDARHVLNTLMELKTDSIYIVNISTSLAYGTSNSHQENLYTSLDEKRQLKNGGDMYAFNVINQPNFSAGAFLGKKFKRVGRALTLNLSIGFSKNKQQGINKSNNLYVTPNGERFMDSINQRNNTNNRNRSTSLSLVYVEPIFGRSYMQLTYTYSNSYSLSDKATYDYNISKNEYDKRNDSLSNFSANRFSLQQCGVRVLTSRDKYDYNIGIDVQYSNLDNNNITGYNHIHQYGVNFSPSAILNYGISSEKKIRISYSGSTQQPSTSQLQPVPDNSNPLYIQLGNPDLRSAFSNSVTMGYISLNPVALRNFSADINVGFVFNKIVYANWFDSLGRQFSQPVNVNGYYNLGASISNNFPLKKQNTSINASVSLGYAQDVGFINGIKTGIFNFNVTPNLSFNYSYKELVNLSASTDASYSLVQYAMQKHNNMWFLNYRFSLDGTIHLPLGVVVGANFDFMLNAGRSEGYNRNVAMLNGFVSKNLFKHKQALVRLQVFDLLNRNSGVSRTIGVNYVETIETAAMRRLVLISFSYLIRKRAGHKQ